MFSKAERFKEKSERTKDSYCSMHLLTIDPTMLLCRLIAFPYPLYTASDVPPPGAYDVKLSEHSLGPTSFEKSARFREEEGAPTGNAETIKG